MNLDFIAKPFGILMQLIYNTVAFKSYGLAIILFSVFVKLLLFPLNLKQQISMIKQQELAPELEELKKVYGKDKEKFQEEQLKLYSKYNINPMAGCFPLLIQFPILITLYQIVTKPLTFISGISAASIAAIQKIIPETVQKGGRAAEIIVNNFFSLHPEKLSEVASYISSKDIISMRFLGIFDLGLTPSLKLLLTDPKTYIPLLLIPIISALTTYYAQKINTPNVKKDIVKKNDNKAAEAANPLNTMTKVMPLITLFFTFSVPAGVGLYWIIGNFLGIVQSYVTKTFIQKKKEGNE